MADVTFALLNRRLNKAVATASDTLFNRQPLIFDERIPDVPADDAEIYSVFRGNVFAADIIMDGQQALVYEAGYVAEYTNGIFNLKMGSALEQGLIDLLNKAARNVELPEDEGLFGMRVNVLAASLMRGIRLRRNAIKCAMVLGAFNYNRFGIQISNANWGEPSTVKTTVGTVWTNTSSTPISDILTQAKNDLDNHGEVRNRVTMSTNRLRNIFATTEFQNLYKDTFKFAYSSNSFGVLNDDDGKKLVAKFLGDAWTVETHDTSFRVRNSDGSVSQQRVQPEDKVILWNTEDDGNPDAWNWGNTVVTESIIASIPGMPGVPPGLGGNKRGPVSYVTPQDPRFNPPGMIGWSVARGGVRKIRETASSILTVL